MTANLKSTEIVDAAITKMVNAIGTGITFGPKIVQEGDLSFYVEAGTLTDDLPAIFVAARDIEIIIGQDSDIADIGGHVIGTRAELRIVLVDSWSAGDAVVDKRQQRGEEIAQVFIGAAGTAYDLGASISGFTIIKAVPVGMEMDPPESAVVSLEQERQLYAVAITLLVEGRSNRA